MFYRIWHDLWIAIFIILIIIGVFAGQGLVIGFGIMGLLVAGVSWLWNKVSLEDVSYERSLSQNRVFMGEEVHLSISLINKKPVPLGKLETADDIPIEIEMLDAEMVPSANPNTHTLRHTTSVAWYERIRWEYTIKCSQRGLYKMGPVHVESGDLFGFFNNAKTLSHQDYLLVYPG